MSTQMIIRIEEELKNKVSSLAKAEGKTASAVIRELLEGYVRDRDIADYIDELWSRINTKIVARGLTPDGVPRVIAEVGSQK